jgi:hypothetical protein
MSAKTIEDEAREALADAAAASPGPWGTFPEDAILDLTPATVRFADGGSEEVYTKAGTEGTGQQSINARVIARAREREPRLAAEVLRLRAGMTAMLLEMARQTEERGNWGHVGSEEGYEAAEKLLSALLDETPTADGTEAP